MGRLGGVRRGVRRPPTRCGSRTAARAARLRLEDGYLPLDEHGRPRTGFTDSWWLGLSVMQTLMAREHNAVCDALREEYPHMSEERIHQIARLVVSALIAKIHTVEWTPAILGTRTLDTG